MARLPPIPTPPNVLWREFRIRFLPLFAFGLAIVPAVYLWNRVGSGGIAAMADSPALTVRSQQFGVIERLLVEPNQAVEQGQALALVRPFDLRSVFDRLQLELALQRARSQPSVAEDNAMGFERIRVELLRTESEIEIAKVRLAHAEREAARAGVLHREGLLPQTELRALEEVRDALQAEVQAKQAAVGEIRGRLAALTPIGQPTQTPTPTPSPWSAETEALLGAARQSLEPILLVAPRPGVIHYITRQPGETVEPGEGFIGLTPRRSDRIVSYLRQPYPLDLAVGMTVEVTTRERNRRTFSSRVTHVGPRVEAITNNLATIRPNQLYDAGLPFVVAMPPDVDVRPGELVDLRFEGPDSAAFFPPFRPASVPTPAPIPKESLVP